MRREKREHGVQPSLQLVASWLQNSLHFPVNENATKLFLVVQYNKHRQNHNDSILLLQKSLKLRLSYFAERRLANSQPLHGNNTRHLSVCLKLLSFHNPIFISTSTATPTPPLHFLNRPLHELNQKSMLKVVDTARSLCAVYRGHLRHLF